MIPGLGSLEKEMATHSSILAWRINAQGRLAGYSPWGCKKLDMTEQEKHWVQFLDREDPLEEGMATHSSILRQRSLANFK